MQERIDKLIKCGKESEIDRFLSRLEDSVDRRNNINKDVLAKIDALGNTPLDEPKIFEAIQSSGMGSKRDIALLVFSEDEIKNKFSATDIGKAIYLIIDKVTSVKDEDGNFKRTPNTENCELPNFLEVEELLELSAKEQELGKQIEDFKGNKKELEELIEKKDNMSLELFNKTMEVSKLDVEKLTDWEQRLVTMQVFESITNAMLSSQGKL